MFKNKIGKKKFAILYYYNLIKCTINKNILEKITVWFIIKLNFEDKIIPIIILYANTYHYSIYS